MALPGFSDPNAAAAGNARGALGNIANFLYEQAVTKPAVQAQTAQTQAQTQATQQNTAIQAIGIPSLQQQAVFATHPGVSKNTLTSTHPMSTDVSTGANAVQSSTTSTPSGAAGDGQSGPPPASSMSPQLPNTPAGGTVNQVGSSTQGASSESSVSAPKPGTLAQPKFPLSDEDIDKLGANGISVVRPSAPVATGSASGATSSPPPTGMATPPVSPSASVKQPEPGFNLREHLGEDMGSYPQWKQDQILADLRQPFIDKKVPVPSDAALTGYFRDQQSAYYPSVMQRVKNLTPVGAEVNGVKYANMDAVNSDNPQQVVGPGGVVENKNFRNPDQIASAKEELANMNQIDTEAKAAQDAIKNDPSLVGTIGGSKAGNLVRSGESAVGHPANKEGEIAVKRFLTSQQLSALTNLHLGRITQLEYDGIMQGLPQQSSPKEVWDNYFAKEYGPKTEARRAAINSTLPKSEQKLPSVSLSAPVTAPDQASAGVPLPVMQTPADAKKLAPGTWFQTPSGQRRQAH
jgi:hypothetical protein